MTEPLRCSFCTKSASDVRKLIAGLAVHICDECVDVCVDIILDDTRWSQGAPQVLVGGKPSRLMEKMAANRTDTCRLCGVHVGFNESLPIKDRGVLCGGCADAVDDALAQGRPEN